MSKFLTEKYKRLKPYTPGEQPQDKKYIKLNTNESPFPPSPAVLDIINSSEAANLKLYSDPTSSELKKSIAGVYGVDPKNIFVSNGSDDILNFSFMAYGHNGAAYADITYGFYSVFAELHGIDSTVIPLNDDFTLNKEAFKNCGKLVVIANPNAPTGISLSLNEVEEIVKSNPENVVLIDEAYVDLQLQSGLTPNSDFPV